MGGDEELEKALESHRKYLLRYALFQLRDPSLAEDAVQDTLIAALAHRDGFQGRSQLRTWLTAILKHKIIDLIRKRDRGLPADAMLLGDEDHSANSAFNARGRWIDPPTDWGLPDAALESNQFWRVYQECCQRMPERHAMVFTRTKFPSLKRRVVETLQLNLGYRCNQSCVHCHVNAGPNRKEEMTAETIDAVIAFLAASPEITAIDLTGGAPELNPNFQRLVIAARARGLRVIDRCNLTILEEPGFEDLADFLAAHRVEVVASMPCYLEENVDKQRGKGTFDASIRGLKRLNALGYGRPASALVLNLVYNPQGASLPPPQGALEADYKAHLGQHFGIVFNQLFTLANMPIQRFGSMLISKGQFNAYMTTLREAHRDDNLEHVMCRSLISVDWQGYIYDCDFNQQLGLALTDRNHSRLHITTAAAAALDGLPIRVADHCYGCTAGQGSSCGGALDNETAPAPSCAA